MFILSLRFLEEAWKIEIKIGWEHDQPMEQVLSLMEYPRSIETLKADLSIYFNMIQNSKYMYVILAKNFKINPQGSTAYYCIDLPQLEGGCFNSLLSALPFFCNENRFYLLFLAFVIHSVHQ